MAKPSRHNIDDSSDPGSSSASGSKPPLSKSVNGQSLRKKDSQGRRPRQTSPSTMSLLITGASILLGMLIIVAIIQQRAINDSGRVAEAEPTVPTPTEIAKTSPPTTKSIPETAESLIETSSEPARESGGDANATEATAVSVTETQPTVVATIDPAPAETTLDDELEEDTPEATDPTAADFESRIATAAELIKAKKGKEAITTLKKASGAYPKEFRADFYLGLIYSGVGLKDPKNAEIHFKRVLEREPGHVATLNNLGLVSINARKYPAARNYFSQAIKLDPRPVEVDQNLGRMLSQAKILDLKSDQVKLIKALKPIAGLYHSEVGWLYMPLDRTEKSFQEYESFTKTGQLEDQSCCNCLGHGTVTCRACGGRKSAVATGTVGETKNLGYGQQTTVTPVNTLVACPGCRGQGRVDCTICYRGTDPNLRTRR